jgi:hypothetical protein
MRARSGRKRRGAAQIEPPSRRVFTALCWHDRQVAFRMHIVSRPASGAEHHGRWRPGTELAGLGATSSAVTNSTNNIMTWYRAG